MKIPLSWLRDYVPLTLGEADLIRRLTFAGLEVAATKVFGLPIPEGVRVKVEERGPVWDRDKVFVAEVLSVDKHPNADRLKLPTVSWGEGNVKQLVTGAPNINVGDQGQKVVLALCGSVLIDGHAEERKFSELKPTKIRGLPSDAMVCSLLELGISERKEDHEGILILEPDAPVGAALVDFMGDVVLEIDVLPNMARCLSILGIAREVAALTGQSINYPSVAELHAASANEEAIEGQVRVAIEDPKLSARYAAALIRNVTIGPAPGWMQRRLLYAGMRPINNIVDITNYVMLEWGQPLHAFDYDILKQRAGGAAPTITVRPARAGEVLATLDKQKRELTPEHLVIADSAGPIALAGVMGGLETEVGDQTKNILLESASFDFVSVRRTFKQFNLPSEASARFSRGIHPEMVRPAAERAADLMRRHAGGTVCRGLVDCYPAPLPARIVALKLDKVSRLLGMEFPKSEAIRILRSLEFEVQEKGDTLQATVPAHRLDIQVGDVDLIEELARIHGYDRLPETLLADQLPRQQNNPSLTFEERLRDILVGCGLQEVITYALTEPGKETPLLGEGAAGSYVHLKNPISSDRSAMRQTVLAGVLEAAASNLRNNDGVRHFELGFIYVARSGRQLPEELRRVSIVMTGKRDDEFWADSGTKPTALDFFDLKGIIEAVLHDLHLPDVAYRTTQANHLHPGKSAAILSAGEALGVFGELHPGTVMHYGLGERTVLVADLDVDALQRAMPARYAFTPVPRFPAALRDVAIVIPEDVPSERVLAEIRSAGGDLLKQVRLFDLYRGESIAAGTKSLAYALSYQADDRTLTEKEIDKAHKKIEDRLKHVLKAQIRGK